MRNPRTDAGTEAYEQGNYTEAEKLWVTAPFSIYSEQNKSGGRLHQRRRKGAASSLVTRIVADSQALGNRPAAQGV